MQAVQHQAGLLQPSLQRLDRRAVAVIEVRPRCEQLDRLEAVDGDLRQMVPAQPLIVIEVRRNAELHGLLTVRAGR